MSELGHRHAEITNDAKTARVRTGTVTRALRRAEADDEGAIDEVVRLVYKELSALARNYLRRERDDHTLDTRGLVHEAYMRLAGQRGVHWENRRHYYGIAAQHMRRILCDYARRHHAEKRGGHVRPLRLSGLDDLVGDSSADLSLDQMLTIDQVLSRLQSRDHEAMEIAQMRCVLGLKMVEISRETGIPMRSLSRKWRSIRAWLLAELNLTESQPPPQDFLS